DPYFSLKNHQLLTIKLGHSATTAFLTQLEITESTTMYSNFGGYTSSSWIKGSDGQYRSKEDEKKRLEELDAAASRVFDGSVEDAITEAELDKVFPPRGGENYAGFRENTPSDLSLLPWLPAGSEQSKSEKGGKAAESTSKKAGAKEPVKPLEAHGTKPLSVAERDYKLSCGCFCCDTV